MTATFSCEERTWAEEEFGGSALGDRRRCDRLVRMAAAVAERPAGRVLDVFRSSAERQGAYDFLSNPSVAPEALADAMSGAAVGRLREEERVFVAIDGTSLKLRDWRGTKGFGSIGARDKGAVGLKVVHGFALSGSGIPAGIVAQSWWTRSGTTDRRDCQSRPIEQKETKHWVAAVKASASAFATSRARLWYQVDREGDRYGTLGALRDTGHLFTVRSTYAHRRGQLDGREERLVDALAKASVRWWQGLEVPASHKRTGRIAQLEVRTLSAIRLPLRDTATRETTFLTVNVVEVREVGTTPSGEAPVHWRLLTNHGVTTDRDVRAIIDGYALRWRVEDLHRTWKSGACNVEKNQLRSPKAAIRWAMILVANAARIERIKHLARNEPEAPASREFTHAEIEATRMMKRKYKKRTETIGDEMPTVGQLTLWLAELGGYTGKSSGGPPGSITIKRGLDFILPIAAALEQLEEDGLLRSRKKMR
jgi:hypothetical protein